MAELKRGWVDAVHANASPQSPVFFGPEDRWMFAKAEKAEHEALSKVWPRMGCVGNYASNNTYQYYFICVKYLSDIMKHDDYLLMGDVAEFPDQPTGYCNASSIYYKQE